MRQAAHRFGVVAGGIVSAGILLGGCASSRPWSLEPPPAELTEMRPLPSEPSERDPSLYWDAVNQSSFYLVENSLNLGRQTRKLTGSTKDAHNADSWGNVPNSAWFTNRHGSKRMTPDEILRGPNTIDGPDTTHPWMITRAKTEGVTPGFFAQDSNGVTFIIKFDPDGHPELATGAEMISTKFFHACGYNVPENYISVLDPNTIRFKEGLEYADQGGNRKPFTRDVLNEVLQKVARRPDGKVRVVASRFLPGTPIGPFSYKGTRKDDPNDFINHQHRRELRGLKVLAQLVNHYDTKDHNTLDIIADDGNGPYVRHYLIDFGSTLGSDADEPKPHYKGYAYTLDLEQAVVSLFTLGLRQWSWEGASSKGMPPAVGYFESERFTPPGWKPLHANPAFDNIDDEDAYWGARIVGAFTEDDLRACVEAAEYSDPAAEEYLVKTLMERRRKILDYYYGNVSPLDAFAISQEGGALALSFVDRFITDGLTSESAEFRYRVGHKTGSWGSYISLLSGTSLTLDQSAERKIANALQSAQTPDDRVFNITLQARHNGRWHKPVRVYFYYDGTPASARLVGIDWDA